MASPFGSVSLGQVGTSPVKLRHAASGPSPVLAMNSVRLFFVLVGVASFTVADSYRIFPGRLWCFSSIHVTLVALLHLVLSGIWQVYTYVLETALSDIWQVDTYVFVTVNTFNVVLGMRIYYNVESQGFWVSYGSVAVSMLRAPGPRPPPCRQQQHVQVCTLHGCFSQQRTHLQTLSETARCAHAACSLAAVRSDGVCTVCSSAFGDEGWKLSGLYRPGKFVKWRIYFWQRNSRCAVCQVASSLFFDGDGSVYGCMCVYAHAHGHCT